MPREPRSSFRLKPLPPSYWDEVSKHWDRVLSVTFRKRGTPHRFYYYEADRYISSRLNRGMRVLEVGCGTGGSTAIHAQEARRTIATDLSRDMVHRAARKLRRHGSRNRLDFAVVDAERLPFCDSAFDAVTSRGVALSYVSDPEHTLREFRRVLKSGGRLLIDAMNRLDRRDLEPGVHRQEVHRFWSMFGKDPALIEISNRRGRQVRRVHFLRENSPYCRRARKERACRGRPRDLRKNVRAVRVFEAQEFSAEDLKGLLNRAGFRRIELVPLGQMWRATQVEDPEVRRFANENQTDLSNLSVALSKHIRLDSALHFLIDAQKG